MLTMKRLLLFTILIFSTFSLSAQLSEAVLEFEPTWAYQYEQLELIGKVNGSSQVSRVEMELITLEGKIDIIEQREGSGFLYIQSTDEGIDYVETTFTVVPLGSENVILQVNVKDLENNKTFESNTITLELLPQPSHPEAQPPYRDAVNLNLRKKEIYQGEETLLLVEAFSDGYVRNMEDLKLNLPLEIKYLREADEKEIYFQGEYSTLYTLPTMIYSNEVGTFNIPKQNFHIQILEQGEYRFESVQSNSTELIVIETPGYSEELILASKMKIYLSNYREKIIKGEEIYFTATLLADGCLDNVESLSDYFNGRVDLEERVIARVKTFDGNRTVYKVVFEYTGLAKSLVGVKIPKIIIPYFNTIEGEHTQFEYSFERIEGNIDSFQFWAFVIIIFAVVILTAVGIFFYIRNFRKKGKKGGARLEKDIPIDDNNMAQFLTFVEEFSLTQREKDILKVLVEGKSTKDIADTLYISPETAKKHITNIMKKTQTHSRYEIYVLLDKHVSQNGQG